MAFDSNLFHYGIGGNCLGVYTKGAQAALGRHIINEGTEVVYVNDSVWNTSILKISLSLLILLGLVSTRVAEGNESLLSYSSHQYISKGRSLGTVDALGNR